MNYSITPNRVVNESERSDAYYVSALRRRSLRNSESLLQDVFVEELENKVLCYKELSNETIKYVISSLEKGKIDYSFSSIACKEGFDLDKKLLERLRYESLSCRKELPKKVVHIVGCFRSGTTYLYNLMVYQKAFAYFTHVSHHLWSTYNLKHEKRQLIEYMPCSVLADDTMKTRNNLSINVPSEGQEIFNKSINVHTYLGNYKGQQSIHPIVDLQFIKSAIEKHVAIFKREVFLSKDPYNSLRIKYLQDLYPNTYFIHIFRNGYDTVRSMNEYGFINYTHTGEVLTGTKLWSSYINSILTSCPKDRTLHISYEKLRENPINTLTLIFAWLGVKLDLSQQLLGTSTKIIDVRTDSEKKDKEIDRLNTTLSNLTQEY